MKIKIKSLRRDQRVYYFEHKNGVLKNKKTNKYSLLTSLVSTFVVLGGVGVGINTALNYEPKSTSPSYQREGVSIDAQKTTDASGDKLKSASTKAREDEQLAKDIKSKLKNVPGGQKWSVYVRDLNSDRMASINADSSVDASGGLGNLFLAAPLEAKMPSANWNYRVSSQTMAKTVESMINSNDANAVKLVKQRANLKNADKVNESLGFKKTTIAGKEQKTTAREAGDLLFRLQNGQVLSDKARRTVFDGLYGHKYREGVRTGCDQGCLVANITNESNGTRSEAAIVTTGSARYVVVISTKDASWSQIADVAASIRLVMQP